MQISSVGSAHNLLTGKMYSTGSVIKHLTEESDSAKKLEDEKNKIDTESKISAIVEASSKEALKVTNIDSLYAVDDDLKNMLRLSKYASGDISSDDRKICEQEFNSYYNDIGTIDKSEQAALKKYYTDNPDAAKAAVSAEANKTAASGSADSSDSEASSILSEMKALLGKRPTWYQALGIEGVSVDTKEDAADAVERIGGRYKAIDTVEDEIKKLTRKTGTQLQQQSPTHNSASVNKKSEAEYVTLLETSMQGDTKKAAITGDADASTTAVNLTAENSSGGFYNATGTALDTIG